MPPADIEPDDLAFLKFVVETAKKYFKNPKRFEKAQREMFGETDDSDFKNDGITVLTANRRLLN